MTKPITDRGNAAVGLVDALSANRSAVRDACTTMASVAAALHRVGLREIADELGEAIAPLEQSVEHLNRAYTADMDRQMAHSNEMSGNILRLALNGNLVPSPGKAP